MMNLIFFGKTILEFITHVMDCEHFVVDKCVMYREISICNLKETSVKKFQ